MCEMYMKAIDYNETTTGAVILYQNTESVTKNLLVFDWSILGQSQKNIDMCWIIHDWIFKVLKDKQLYQ